MKPQKTLLVCFTSWGSICLREVYPSKSAAVNEGRWMIDNGFAFSYKTKAVA